MSNPVVASQVINPLTPCEVTVHLLDAEGQPVEMTVKLSYYRGKLTKSYFNALDAYLQIDDEDEAKRQLDLLALRIIGRWNVLQEAGGQPIPLTPEALFPVDSVFLFELLHGITNHFASFVPGGLPGVKQNGASNHTSAAKSAPQRLSPGASRRKR